MSGCQAYTCSRFGRMQAVHDVICVPVASVSKLSKHKFCCARAAAPQEARACLAPCLGQQKLPLSSWALARTCDKTGRVMRSLHAQKSHQCMCLTAGRALERDEAHQARRLRLLMPSAARCGALYRVARRVWRTTPASLQRHTVCLAGQRPVTCTIFKDALRRWQWMYASPLATAVQDSSALAYDAHTRVPSALAPRAKAAE